MPGLTALAVTRDRNNQKFWVADMDMIIVDAVRAKQGTLLNKTCAKEWFSRIECDQSCRKNAKER